MEGPAITPTWNNTAFTDTAPGNRVFGTRFGVIACPAGAQNARATPNNTIAPNTMATLLLPESVNHSRMAAPTSSAVYAQAMMMRRSNRSATWPPGSTSARNGRNCARPMRPRSSGSRVMFQTWKPTTTFTICQASVPARRPNA